MRFLDSLGIPIIAVLRDSQNFVHSAEQGVGIHEMPPSRVRPDAEQLARIVDWLDGWQERRSRALELHRAKNAAPRPAVLGKSQFRSA